jgi:hypothetical protein
MITKKQKDTNRQKQAIKAVLIGFCICWAVVFFMGIVAGDIGASFMVGFFFTAFFAFFLIPTWISIYRKQNHTLQVFIFNIFGISWPIALIMAVTDYVPIKNVK